MNRAEKTLRNNKIVYMVLYDHMKLEEVGDCFGLKRETVRRIVELSGIDYQTVLERRKNLGLVSGANPFAARIDPITIIRTGPREGLRTPEYAVYRGMLDRCHNPNHSGYEWYGGRGITVCDRWRGEYGYEFFLIDMGPRPGGFYASGRAELSIHRIDNDGPYVKENCKWATQEEQCANQRPRKLKVKDLQTSTDTTVSPVMENAAAPTDAYGDSKLGTVYGEEEALSLTVHSTTANQTVIDRLDTSV